MWVWCAGRFWVLGQSPPALALGPGHSCSPPFLAGGCKWKRGRFLANLGGGLWVQFPATPGWGKLLPLVPGHSWLRALGVVPRHS